VLEARSAVSKQLEILRVDNKIGSSLDAEVALFCNGELQQHLNKLEDELRFVMITSAAQVDGPEARPDAAVEAQLSDGQSLYIMTEASPHEKCVRCWHHRADVGNNNEHPGLCGRCIENVVGNGENRRIA